jgi:hypothetical protein
MIDTLHLEKKISLDVEKLGLGWGKTIKIWNRRKFNEHEMVKHELKLIVGGANVLIRYYPNDYSDNPLLVIEISSIPKIINAVNVPMLDNEQQAFDKINNVINSIAGFPEQFDIRQCHILRIDIVHDFYVGYFIQDYLQVISQLIYKHREKAVYTNQKSHGISNGIFFHTKRGPTLKFYDKGVETGKSEYYGMLRQESCVRGAASLMRSFGTPSPKLIEITEEMQKSVLLNDLNILGLDKIIHGEQDIVFEILKEKYGTIAAFRLKETIEVLNSKKKFNLSLICNELGIKKSTYYTRLKQIKEAGLVPALYTGEKILKPLSDYF